MILESRTLFEKTLLITVKVLGLKLRCLSMISDYSKGKQILPLVNTGRRFQSISLLSQNFIFIDMNL